MGGSETQQIGTSLLFGLLPWAKRVSRSFLSIYLWGYPMSSSVNVNSGLIDVFYFLYNT
jgi:hypothetical protein